MLQLLDPAGAFWEAPRWATSEELVDYGTVEHRACVGEVAPAAPEAPFVVDVVQNDELVLDAAPISLSRGQAQVSVAGIRFSADQARDLARLLDRAADLIAVPGPAVDDGRILESS